MTPAVLSAAWITFTVLLGWLIIGAGFLVWLHVARMVRQWWHHHTTDRGTQ